MVRKLLIANRGEIARRIARTCRRLGIPTVAVHSEADAAAAHVVDCDEAVEIGPPPPGDSYLRIDRIVAAARRTGADAIHPGYGFLSENAEFARACAEAGLTFVGPSPDVIALMGDKAAAKARMAEAGVPVVPGIDGSGMDDETLVAAGQDVGFPLLVKAVAGGGGKGMRAVHDPHVLADAVAAARREAAGAFGDDRLILERLIQRPRHVEIQVFGDTHGGVVHLFERECSIQRRHQKIVEETPSPAVDAALRERMGEAAATAAEAVGYVGAGTVEFVLGADGAFHFLEMNTRLQVEHPVTELTTGVDLVEWQLRVADGERLPRTQAELTQTGHAIEVRLYAEDPTAGFLPQTGPVLAFEHPVADDVRVDAGVVTGSTVSRFYDPMLAKLVVHGGDRDTAIDRMAWLLDHTTVLGVRTNVEHLRAVVGHPAFRAGDTTTDFLATHLDGWSPEAVPREVVVATAVRLQAGNEQAAAPAGDPYSPWRRLGPWRTGQVGGWQVRLTDGDTTHRLAVTGRAGTFRVATGDGVHRVTVAGTGGEVGVDGHEVPLQLATHHRDVWVHTPGLNRRLHHEPPTHHVDPTMLTGTAAFTAPMPGAVTAIDVEVGDHVAGGTRLLVVEAMKMEHPVAAPGPGTVRAVHVRAGEAVDGDQVLLEFEPDPLPDAEEDA